MRDGTLTLALAGDTMLGRGVAKQLAHVPPPQLFADEVVAIAHEADLFLLNLECAISERGERWPDPRKPFFFRAPLIAIEALTRLGVDCVSLANNHALDFGATALLDTIGHLSDAGIACVGAGATETAAHAPAILEKGGVRVGLIGVTDHPSEYAAGNENPGVAYVDLRRSVPSWLKETVRDLRTDVVVVSPHWGPNMVAEPVPHVRRAAAELRGSGATLIAGHSAHIFHGVTDGVLYDLGDFIDDYATNRHLRNDLGLLFLVTFRDCRPIRVEAVPLALDYCFTRLANRDETAWITARFRRACADLGTSVDTRGGRLVIDWPDR
jgi:poly-gamma-glutamate synthesis protein (capsule biosynthesis protein)